MGKLLDVLEFAAGLWRRFRFGPRIEIDLGWWRPPITTLGTSSTRYWRGISVEVVASKDEEFVVAGGDVEARAASSYRWGPISPLERFLPLPVEVEPNQSWSDEIEGETLAEVVEEALDPSEPVQLRVRAEDHHGTALKSNSLETTVEELRREKVERY